MDRELAAGGQKAKANLIIDCKYQNDLPPPPVPKLLRALPAARGFYEYSTTSLELDHRPFLLSEEDVLANVELIAPDYYGVVPEKGSMGPPPPPCDRRILTDSDLDEKGRESEGKRKRLVEISEAWHREAFGLQRPQLISNDVYTERQKFSTGTQAAEKKLFREPPERLSLDQLIKRVEKTFDDARETPVHPTRPELKPKRVLPIVPDAALWANRYRQVCFDELPHEPEREDILFKTVPTPRLTCFGYFTRMNAEEAPGAYTLTQNYVWDNRGAYTRACAAGDEGLLLSLPPDGEVGEVRFVPITPPMRLKKQKARRLDIGLDTHGLSVAHRDLSNQESLDEQTRMSAVLSDEVCSTPEGTSIEYVDGEWRINTPDRVKTPDGEAAAGTPPPERPALPIEDSAAAR